MQAKYNRDPESTDGFAPMFPTVTQGRGRVRSNSANTGRGQGRGTNKKMVDCKICGYWYDINRNDHAGGDLSGDGGNGDIALQSIAYILLNGDSHTDNFGAQTMNQGGGCPLCGTKNGVGRQ